MQTAPYEESDLLPISALQHLSHCKRRCALTHIEQSWEENRFTAEGNIFHEHVHEQGSESRVNIRIVRGLRLRSLELGLSGIADVIEFHFDPHGCTVPSLNGTWRVYPVEYKRGTAKFEHAYEIQLCAQTLCLNEMLNTEINSGALYFGAHHKRKEIHFTEELVMETKKLAVLLHDLIQKGITPPPVYDKKCTSCSLSNICMPKLNKKMRVDKYLNSLFEETTDEAST